MMKPSRSTRRECDGCVHVAWKWQERKWTLVLGVPWWEPGECCFRVLCQRVLWTCRNLSYVAPPFLRRFNIQTTSARCGKPFSLFKASLWQGTGMGESTWLGENKAVLLPAVALWVASSEKPLFDLELWRDQTSFFNGRECSSENPTFCQESLSPVPPGTGAIGEGVCFQGPKPDVPSGSK